MASLTGPVYVPAPNPTVPRYGLFKVATGPLDLPVHARIGGLQYETGTCVLPDPYEVECLADHNTKTLDGARTLVIGNPFIVFSNLLCGTVGLTDARLRLFMYEQLKAGEQAVVENVFSRGLVAQAPSLLTSPTDLTPTPGTAVDLVRAVSLLESWLYARYGLPGVLHVPAALQAYFSLHHQVEKDAGGVYRTRLGTAVSFGNYAGLTTAGAAPAAGQTFIYITGQVAIWRTRDEDLEVTTVAQALNRATNTVTAVMEREFVIAYDCYNAAVQSTISGTVA